MKPSFGQQRQEASGPGWQERFVDAERAHATASVALAFSESLSYIVLSEFATPHECCALQNSAQTLQDIYLKHGDGNVDIFRGIVIKWVSEVSRFSVKGLLDEHANAVSDTLLRRLLDLFEFGQDRIADNELSEIALQVFGAKANLQEKRAKWYDEMSHDDKVSNPEPMVNIYEEGGYFKRHGDGMHMTLLVVLEEALEGGGTAFYTNDDDDDETIMDEHHHDNPLLSKTPQRIEMPPVGTAMIWGAKLLHSAMPVLKGSRTVFVGSFDLVEHE
jgi:hypothetical protein